MLKLRKGTLAVFQHATRRGTPRDIPSSEYPWGTPLWGARWVLLLGVPFQSQQSRVACLNCVKAL